MKDRAEFERFSLLGGPLYRLGCRLGLVRGETNTTAIGLALGGGLWAVMIALALVFGAPRPLFTLSLIAGHVRLLIVIPLFFVCESWLDPQLTAFAGSIHALGGRARPRSAGRRI